MALLETRRVPLFRVAIKRWTAVFSKGREVFYLYASEQALKTLR